MIMVFGLKMKLINEIYIINGASKKDPFLEDVFISKFNNNFDLIENIFAKKIDITKINGLLKIQLYLKIIVKYN